MTPGRGGGTYFFVTLSESVLFAEKSIMGYTQQEREFAVYFRGGVEDGYVPGTGIRIVSEVFHSSGSYRYSDGKNVASIFNSLFRSKELEHSNDDFRYYLLIPDGSAGRGAIILLHGLNERSWNKYMQWGMRLASDTGRPVVLFPSAYHMNRSPRSWIDRHLMTPLVTARTTMLPDTQLSTFVNVALSTRMSSSPQRFLLSGYQTLRDLASLTGTVREGSHPHLPGGGPVDIFAYSIGALAAQVMMLSRPSLLPPESRMLLFCGGSAFGLMNGTSKLIMDSRAFERLVTFYLEWPDDKMSRDGDLFMQILNGTPEGEAFYAMTSLSRLKDISGTPFVNTGGKLKAITFAGDRVIPAEAVSATLQGADAEVWSPDYPFTHENPFPVLAGDRSCEVDRTFDRLFTTAAGFFS
ncbi:MAG: hypothetical protein IH592_00075 [Bacteroidales bacterium]|nr:hypothetical protein [Bacteroidales bacterium]